MKKASLLLFVCLSVLFLFSCSRSTVVASLKKEVVFSLDYGSFEDQLNLFSLQGTGDIKTDMVLRDGFFYIVNGESEKIMEFNSYGDLLTLFYNEEKNARPSFLPDNSSSHSTRKGIVYPFNSPQYITVDSRKNIYVVDTLPPERQEQDKENNLLYNQVVLRFASNGDVLDYIGQQGPGGTTFPYIQNIYTTHNDELVVVCKTNGGPLVFWYAQTGYLKYKMQIDSSKIAAPGANADSADNYVSIGNVVPDPQDHLLFVKADYYSSYVDEASKVKSGVDYKNTLLYPLDMETGRYGEPYTIPSYEDEETDGFTKMTYEVPYDFLGVTENGWMFFLATTNTGYMIQMIQMNSQKILRRHIAVDHKKTLYLNMALSQDGIITGLFITKDKADVVWWRTDQLIAAILKE